MRRREIRIVLVILVACWALYPQSAPAARWRVFTSSNGLPADSVRDLTEASDGAIWAATPAGLVRFERLSAGARWEIVDPRAFTHVATDAQGVVWAVDADAAVLRFAVDGSALAAPHLDLSQASVRDLEPDYEGGMLVATSAGLMQVSMGGEIEQSAVYDAGRDVRVAAAARNGSLWWGTNDCRVVQRVNGIEEVSVLDAGYVCFPTALRPLADGGVIASTQRGDVWFRARDTSTWVAVTVPGQFTAIEAAVEDALGRVLLCRQDQVIVLDRAISPDDPTQWGQQVFSNESGLVGDRLLDVLETGALFASSPLRAGSRELWFASDRGVSVQADQPWLTFTGTTGALIGEACFVGPGDCDAVGVIASAPDGAMWFGTAGGLARRSAAGEWSAWGRSLVLGGDLINPNVIDLVIDADGTTWIATGGSEGTSIADPAGLQRLRDGTWTTIGRDQGRWRIGAMSRDDTGRFWLGTEAGLVELDTSSDPVTAISHDAARGLPWAPITAVAHHGSTVVVAAAEGLARLDEGATTWALLPFDEINASACRQDAAASVVRELIVTAERIVAATAFGLVVADRASASLASARTFAGEDGLDCTIYSLTEDVDGGLLIGSVSGIQRLTRELDRVGAIGALDGLPGQVVTALARRGDEIWMGFAGDGAAVHRFEPPQTAIIRAPPTVVINSQSATFLEVAGVDPDTDASRLRYELRVGESAWVAVGMGPSVSFVPDAFGLADGEHSIEVRAVDPSAWVDRTPAQASFELDTEPPTPVLSAPAASAAVRGLTEVRGRAADARFARYRVEAHPSTSLASSAVELLAWNPVPVDDGLLVQWDTSLFDDDRWTLRLVLEDMLGVRGVAQIEVLVDNHPPFADRTSPVAMEGRRGGVANSIAGDAELAVPALAFEGRATLTVEVVDDPASIGGRAFEIGPSALALAAPAVLRLLVPEGTPPENLGIWRLDSGGPVAISGTPESGDGRTTIVAPITTLGRFALRSGRSAGTSGVALVEGFDVQPRYLDPREVTSASGVDIVFTLTRAAEVRAVVYSRNGRPRRVITSGRSLGPGAQALRWDGRDHEGELVATGLYIVQLDVGGERHTQVVGVGRR